MDRWRQIDSLFHAAAGRPPEDRAAFLDQACGGDEALRREVESLLGADAAAGEIATNALPAQVAAEMLDAQPTRFSASDTIGHYRILSPLGAGGMGEVYLAEDTRLKRKVALKVLPTQFTSNPDRVRRFEQEAHAVSALNHPNIITLFELGRAEDHFFMATEYIDGQTLRERLREVGRLPVGEAIEIASQICRALAAAHEAGVIHRDIKPENVMIRRDGFVKVLDFGLAKISENQSLNPDTSRSSLTGAGAVMGTASYMSPEQARGQRVDARTDIFSLGIVLYEMVAGRSPFEGANMFEVVAGIMDREAAPLTRRVPDAPSELEQIVNQALRKEPEQRYQTAGDLLRDLNGLKEELAFAAKLERSGQTGKKGSVAAVAENTSTSPHSAVPTTSSTKIIFGEVKRHKLAALMTLLILIAAGIGAALYFRVKTEAAIDSIAVLPFVNQNRDQETEFLSDGLTESIINNLTRLPDLRVIARNSAFLYKGKELDLLGAGQALGVRAVVVGRVLQRGDELIVSAELVDVRENKQLWGQQYNRKLAAVFEVQSEIAREISEKLRIKLTNAEQQKLVKQPTENLKAFEYFLQGQAYNSHHTREDLLTAIRYYEMAIAEDSNYALAYTGLASVYGTLASFGFMAPMEGRRKMEEAARKAVALDDNLAEAHAMLGFSYVNFAPFNFSLGDPELQRALKLSPGSALAHQHLSYSLLRQGRLEECLKEILKAHELDPLSSTIARNVAYVYYFKRDYAQSLERLRRANELGPAFSSPTEIGIHIRNRMFNEALAELEQAKQRRKDDPVLMICTGMIYAAQGKREDASQIIKELETKSGANQTYALWIAKIYSTLNEDEPALTWLERGLEAGVIGAFYKDEPVWDVIRNKPQFADLLRRMGVPQ